MDLQSEIIVLLRQIAAKIDSAIAEDESLGLLEVPKSRQFGDFSTNLAMLLAKKTQNSPLEIAAQIKKDLESALGTVALGKKIAKVEIKGPGFINFFVHAECLSAILDEIHDQKNNFGKLYLGKGAKIHLEFVSANPTGPLNVAHGRQAAFGDTLANMLQRSGYAVTREYYLNDEGVQMNILGESTRAKYLKLVGREAEFPADGYKGKYIDELAALIAKKYGRKFADRKDERCREFFVQFAGNEILAQIKKDLRDFGVEYDSWFSQRKLNRSGKITEVLDYLKKEGFLFQKEGAWWLASTRFGDDKDRVVIKSDGNLTYIAPDIAYHKSKFLRGYTRLINIWGPDHHGYISRIKAAVSALGYDAQSLTVLIAQLVSLVKADQVIPMSTRQGQYVSLADIIHAVGKDAARFFFLMRKRDSHLQFDLELAKSQSMENPVYYIQYAHARCCNILKLANSVARMKMPWSRSVDLALLDKPEEAALIQTLGAFPAVIEYCVNTLEPHRITSYLQDLAKDFHHYYEKHRVVTQDIKLTRARLYLVEATRIVLRNGLRLMAISAPEKM